MRIIAGAWRGRRLQAPAGLGTRPTADRVRQALFDMIMHAPWGGRDWLTGVTVLDAFAGTGALGLEALSRGAGRAIFFERDGAALMALRSNVTACGAADRAVIMAQDVLRAGQADVAASLAFFDPPYGDGLIQRALNVMTAKAWITPETVLVAEAGRLETVAKEGRILAHRVHGAAQLVVWRV